MTRITTDSRGSDNRFLWFDPWESADIRGNPRSIAFFLASELAYQYQGPARRPAMLDEFLNEKVVIDLKSPFVCLGTLARFDDQFIELKGADLHDLRDTKTSRENYVAASVVTGIKRNRKRVLLVRADVVAVSRLGDVSFE